MKIKKIVHAFLSLVLISGCGGSDSDSDISKNYFDVTATSGQGGTITPATQSIQGGSTATFVLQPDDGYMVDYVTGCNGTPSGYKYITGEIKASCSVQSAFKKKVLTINVVVNGQGSVSRSKITLPYGEPAEIKTVPVSGYGVRNIDGCDGVYDTKTNNYRISSVKSDCTVMVDFDKEIAADIKGPALILAGEEGKYALSMLDSGTTDWSLASSPDNSDYRITKTDDKNITLSSSISGNYVLRAHIKRGYLSKTVDIQIKIATPISDDIRSDTLLSLSKSPFFITRDIFIDKDTKLTSEPGIEIYSLNRVIKVYGLLDIRGSDEKKALLINVRILSGVAASAALTQPSVYIENSLFEGGTIFEPDGYGQAGSITLKNNTIKDLERFIYLNRVTANFYKNKFINSAKISVGGSNIHMENNLFVSPRDVVIENWLNLDNTIKIINNSFYGNGKVVIKLTGRGDLNLSAEVSPEVV